MMMDLCSVCGDDLAQAPMKFYLPSAPVSVIYKKLMQAGLTMQASVFLKINQSSPVRGFCTRCWVYDYIREIAFAPETTDADKTAILDIHLCKTAASTSETILWNELGNPELN
jgi:hypothetical protein